MCANREYVISYCAGLTVLAFHDDETMTIDRRTIEAVFFCHTQPTKIIDEWHNLTYTKKTYKMKLIGG